MGVSLRYSVNIPYYLLKEFAVASAPGPAKRNAQTHAHLPFVPLTDTVTPPLHILSFHTDDRHERAERRARGVWYLSNTRCMGVAQPPAGSGDTATRRPHGAGGR